MRNEQAEAVRLVCPVCRKPGPGGMETGRVRLDEIGRESNGRILTGSLKCGKCGAFYPIIDGVPCVLRDVEAWLAGELASSADKPELPKRWKDVKPADVAGGRTPKTERALVDAYMEFHYGQFARNPANAPAWADNEGYWKTVVESAGSPSGMALDLGCSVGRFSFELAKCAKLVVGLDIRLGALRQAAKLQREGKASYGRRFGGKGRESVELEYVAPENVLFTAGDALDPPFAAGSFDFAAAMNLLDNVPFPLVLLGQMDALLRPGGALVLGSPYEWRADICDPVEWLEVEGLGPAETLRRTLDGRLFPGTGFSYDIEKDVPKVGWSMRNHDRFWSHFESHVARARKKSV